MGKQEDFPLKKDEKVICPLTASAMFKLLHYTVFAMMYMQEVTLLEKLWNLVLILPRPSEHIKTWVRWQLMWLWQGPRTAAAEAASTAASSF